MMLSRSRELKVNLGNYEHMQVSAMVVVHGLDLFTEEELEGMDPEELMKELRAFAEKHLDDQLDPELKDAAEMSQADASFVLEQAPTAPRRTEKARSRR